MSTQLDPLISHVGESAEVCSKERSYEISEECSNDISDKGSKEYSPESDGSIMEDISTSGGYDSLPLPPPLSLPLPIPFHCNEPILPYIGQPLQIKANKGVST